MGRDIHWQVEYRIAGRWHWVRPESKYGQYERYIYKWRDMQMFDLLAGAGRGVHKPMFPLRGLPDDLSDRLHMSREVTMDGVVYVQYRVLGEHHQNWLTYAELVELRDRWGSNWHSDLFHTVIPCMNEMLELLPLQEHHDHEPLCERDLRAVFGFTD